MESKEMEKFYSLKVDKRFIKNYCKDKILNHSEEKKFEEDNIIFYHMNNK